MVIRSEAGERKFCLGSPEKLMNSLCVPELADYLSTITSIYCRWPVPHNIMVQSRTFEPRFGSGTYIECPFCCEVLRK